MKADKSGSNGNLLPEDLIELKAGARLLRVSMSTIHRWIRVRRIPAWKVGGRWFVAAAPPVAPMPPPAASGAEAGR